MALSDKQYQALVKQLEQKKAKLGDAEYANFLSKAAAAQSPQEPQDNDGFLKDAAQGVAKSAGDLALGVGSIGRGIQRGVSKVGDAVLGKYNPFQMSTSSVFDAGSTQNNAAKELLKRDTVGEKVGGFVGDVASFAVPGSAVTKASKGANFLTRAAALGASDALVTGVKEGGFDRDAVDAAIIGAAFPVAGKALGAAKSALLPSGKDAGGRIINSLIKPLLKDFSYGKNPGQAVAEAGITANSLDDLATKIKSVRESVGKEIGAKVAGSTATFDATDALKPLDEALESARKSPRTNAAIIRRIEDLKADLLKVNETGEATRKITGLTGDEFWEFNKDIGELTRWTGNATDDELVNKALTRSYQNTRSQLEKGVAGVDVLSEKYANLKSAEVAAIYRDKIAARQGLISFTGAQTGTAAALTSAVLSGGALAPILIGSTVAATTEALKSPAVKTRVASWLASASKEEIKNAFTQAPWLRGAIQSSLFGEEENVDSLSD